MAECQLLSLSSYCELSALGFSFRVYSREMDFFPSKIKNMWQQQSAQRICQEQNVVWTKGD